MAAFPLVMLSAMLVGSTWSIYPHFFGYSAAPLQYFVQPQPLFAYRVFVAPPVSVYTGRDETSWGYSFQTDYEGNGKSQVVFMNGPQANEILQKSIDLLRKGVTPELGRSLNLNFSTTTSTTAPLPASAESSLVSAYRDQMFPANTFPFKMASPPQNLELSLAHSVTNNIANAAENAGEGQESMLHDTFANANPSNTTNTTSTTMLATTTVDGINSSEDSNEATEVNITSVSDEIMETTSSQ